MKSTITFLALNFTLFLATWSSQPVFAAGGELVPLEARSLFVPVGFDDNDEVVVVIEGFLPDPCHRLKKPDIQVDATKKRVIVMPMAERLGGYCFDVLVPYQQVVNVGSLRSADYTVETWDGRLHERLGVARAKVATVDDFPYAPVDHANVVFRSSGKMRAVLSGRYTDTCLIMDHVKVVNSGKTLEVLPVMKKLAKTPEGKPCERRERPFEASADLPELNPGRYLLHVRTLNGQSVNEIFTNLWK